MATNKYVSLNNLSTFLDNVKDAFATKTEMNEALDEIDIIEYIALLNKEAIEANASALKTMQADIEALALKIKANEDSLANFVAISSQEVNGLF